MSISKEEMDEIISRYPNEKPVAFNYMKAREDVFRLINEYKDPALIVSCKGLFDILQESKERELYLSGFCPRCQNEEIGADDKYCKICGLKLSVK